MTKKHKITVTVPQSSAEAEAALRALGKARIAVEEIDTQLKADSQKLKQDAGDAAAPFATDIEKLEAGLTSYAEAHRSALTNKNKSKTGKMVAGYFEWRNLPDKVSTKGVPDIIAAIKAVLAELRGAKVKADIEKREKLQQFVNVSLSLNKPAMLAEPVLAKSFDGVTIGSDGERLEIHIHENSLKD